MLASRSLIRVPLKALKVSSLGSAGKVRFLGSRIDDDIKLVAKGFVNVDSADLDKYLPEGLNKEIKKEFEFSGKQSWMERDVSRLVCSLLDNYEVNRGGNVVTPGSTSSEITLDSDLNGYSDRPEWGNAIMAGQLYGTDIMGSTKPLGKLKDDVMSMSTDTGASNDDFLQKLKELRGDTQPDKILLTGSRGVGKSTVLNQMVIHARKTGWLTLFVPNGWDHVQSGWFIEPVPGNPNLYDNQFMSAELLRGFYLAHADSHLNDLEITHKKELKKYDAHLAKFKENWGNALGLGGREELNFREMREIILGDDHFPEQDELDAKVLEGFDFLNFKPKTLADLVLVGIAFRDLAGMVVLDLVQELKDIESTPVLLAVDEYNTWEVPSVYSYKNEQVNGFQLCVPHALQFITKKKALTDAWTLKNGLCVASTSLTHAQGNKEQYVNTKNSIPLVLQVPSYNRAEFLSALSHYGEQNLGVRGMPVKEVAAFRTQVSSNPREMRREAVPTFFPITIGKYVGEDFMQQVVDIDAPAAIDEDSNSSIVDSVIGNKQ